jgi:hypothetical protein
MLMNVKPRFLSWWKVLKNLVNLSVDVANIGREHRELKRQFNSSLYVSADIGMHDATTVVVLGRMRNKDYVNVFTLHPSSIDEIVNIMRNYEKTGMRIGMIDEIGPVPFVKRALNRW